MSRSPLLSRREHLATMLAWGAEFGFEGLLRRQGSLTARSVAEIAELGRPEAGSVLVLSGFYEPDDGGGGVFHFDASRPRSDHDGGLVIAAGKAWPDLLPRWFDKRGLRGAGCWIRQLSRGIVFEAFGARAEWTDPSNPGFDNSAALSQAIGKASAAGVPILWSKGVYGAAGVIRIAHARGACTIAGGGPERCGIVLGGHAPGIRFEGEPDSRPTLHWSGFSIGRYNADSFRKTIGPKTLFAGHCREVLIENVEEFGAIGFGIQLDYCGRYIIRNNYVHDHFGGGKVARGTDGIHVYRSSGPGEISGNRVERVGDDPISLGSFDSDHPTKDFLVTANDCRHTSGGIKIYGHAFSGSVRANRVVRTDNGGVILWDDRDRDKSFDIQDIEIVDNDLLGCGRLGASAGVYLCAPTGDGDGVMRRISIRNNRILDCHYGVTLYARADGKSFGDVSIVHNTIRRASKNAIFLFDFSGHIDVVSNDIEFIAEPAIRISSDRASGSVRCAENRLRWIDDTAIDPVQIEKRAPFSIELVGNKAN